MKKCLTMFERDPKTFRVIDTVAPGAEWAAAGEGIATKKWDGTCCMVKDGQLFKRYDGSKGKYLPPDFIVADGASSHWLGWRPVGIGPEDRWHNEAWAKQSDLQNGTYELIGPAVNKNPDNAQEHCFRRHGDVVCENVPRTYDGLKSYLDGQDTEGLVFHHPDGRMVKIKLKDFGIRRVAALVK